MVSNNVKQRLQRAEHGQSLVEAALGLTVLMILLMGLLDLGRVYFTYVALEDGAGEAALYLSLNPRCRTNLDNPDNSIVGECDDPNNAVWRARHSGGHDVDWTDPSVDIDIAAAVPAVGERVSVTIKYPFYPITPLITAITRSNPIWLTVRAEQIIVTEAL